MKKTILICLLSFFGLGLIAQNQSLDVDSNLVVNVLDVTHKGSVSVYDLAALTGLEINKSDAVITGYTFSYMVNKTTLVEKKIKGAEFTKELRKVISEFEIDQKFYIEQITVDYQGKTVTTSNPIIIKVKS